MSARAWRWRRNKPPLVILVPMPGFSLDVQTLTPLMRKRIRRTRSSYLRVTPFDYWGSMGFFGEPTWLRHEPDQALTLADVMKTPEAQAEWKLAYELFKRIAEES